MVQAGAAARAELEHVPKKLNDFFDKDMLQLESAPEHVPKKLNDFFDQDMLQLFEVERFLSVR